MNSSSAFQFQNFTVKQEHCAMKIGIDSVLLGAWCPLQNPHHILDIGTGTGLLALMLAQRSKAKIDAIEIDNEAFIQATENISLSPYQQQITTFHTSLQAFKSPRAYDLIISNPPYFNASLLSNDEQRNTARQQTTLTFYDFLSHSRRLINPNGQLVFILPSSTIEEIRAIAKQLHWYIREITMVYGKKGKPAKRCLYILQTTPCPSAENAIIIRESDNTYTAEFQYLTKDFYLPSIFR